MSRAWPETWLGPICPTLRTWQSPDIRDGRWSDLADTGCHLTTGRFHAMTPELAGPLVTPEETATRQTTLRAGDDGDARPLALW